MLIGLVGFIGSGKGTVGDILEEFKFEKQSFAGPVKDVTAAMFGFQRHLLEGDTEESREYREKPDHFWSLKFGRNFTPREALQKMGTEAGRNTFHPNFWIDSLERKMWKNQNYVITDARFRNELEWIKKQGGKIIRVVRGEDPVWMETAERANNGYVTSIAYMNEELKLHESEWRWIIPELIDYKVTNDGSLHDLKIKMINLVEEIRKEIENATV